MNEAIRKNIKDRLDKLPWGLGKKILVPTIQWVLSVPSLWRNNRSWFMRDKFFINLSRLLFTPLSKKKRLLGIWDFHTAPWSVGDPLVFVEILNCLAIKHGTNEVDICVVYDEVNPAGIRKEFFQLSSENARDYILNWLPLFSTCRNLSSVFQFKSRDEFKSFLIQNADRYMLFPTLGNHLSERYNFLGNADLTEIFNFYRDNGFIPHLRIGCMETSWAYDFLLQHKKPGTVPVVLSLKRTAHSQSRNAEPDVWLPFIDRCASSFQEVSFILVGLRGEEPPGIRQRSNVVIAKDYGTTLMEDLALVQKAFMYLAPDSGISTIALFSDTPYIIFQTPTVSMKKYGLASGENFCFATDRQKLFDDTFHMTPEYIFDEFMKLYKKLDREQWLAQARAKAASVSQHPATKVITT